MCSANKINIALIGDIRFKVRGRMYSVVRVTYLCARATARDLQLPQLTFMVAELLWVSCCSDRHIAC